MQPRLTNTSNACQSACKPKARARTVYAWAKGLRSWAEVCRLLLTGLALLIRLAFAASWGKAPRCAAH